MRTPLQAVDGLTTGLICTSSQFICAACHSYENRYAGMRQPDEHGQLSILESAAKIDY